MNTDFSLNFQPWQKTARCLPGPADGGLRMAGWENIQLSTLNMERRIVKAVSRSACHRSPKHARAVHSIIHLQSSILAAQILDALGALAVGMSGVLEIGVNS
jgi:hypothetical protein